MEDMGSHLEAAINKHFEDKVESYLSLEQLKNVLTVLVFEEIEKLIIFYPI